MGWFLTLLILAVLAWFLIPRIRQRTHSDDATAGRDPLDHDHDGLNRPLPGQRASTEGEVHDQAREHVGAHLEEGSPGGRPDGTANTTADGDGDAGDRVGAEDDMHRVEASVRTQPESGADGSSGGARSGSGTGADGGSGAGSRSAAGGGSGIGAGEDSRAGTGRGSDQDSRAGSDGGSDAGAGEESRAGAGGRSDQDSRARSGGGSDAGAGGGSGVGFAAGMDSATLTVPGSPDPDGDPERRLDATTAERAARESENSGGTGTAVLAGIAAAGAAAAGAAGSVARDGSSESDERAERTDHAGRVESAKQDDHAERTGQDDHAGRGGQDDHAERAGQDDHAGRAGQDDHAGRAGQAGDANDGRDTRDGDLTNPPDPDTAGALEIEGRDTDSAAVLRDGEEAGPGRADPSGAGTRTGSDTPSGETASGQSIRDNAGTNAPVADAPPGERARDVVDEPAANVAAADTPSEDVEPEERANPPIESSAGDGGFRDRSIDARSNVVAGTASLAVGGATRVGETERLPNGRADLSVEYGESSDASRLDGGDTAENVREMIKILNLRDGDASRLGISKEEFAQLWHPDGGAPSALVEDVAPRLRRMLG